METLMDAYCARRRCERSHVRFMIAGRCIEPADTAAGLGLEDDDLVEVLLISEHTPFVPGIFKKNEHHEQEKRDAVDAAFDRWLATRRQEGRGRAAGSS